MKRCRHRRICDVSSLLAGVWSTMRRCVDCWEALPMGPARDTERTALEVQAAWAAVSDEWLPYHGEFSVRASFWAGWAGLEDAGDDWEADEYASGALARVIWNHEEEA